MKNLFAECPILIYELNKIMPKNNKLPLLNQDNSDDFFEKLKDKDESAYKEFIKLIIQYRDENLNIEALTTKVEELLSKYPELLEEAMLFIDHKKLNNMNFRKNIINKNNINNNIQNNNNYQNTAENNQINIKKENIKQTQNSNASNIIEKHQTNKHHFHHYMSQLPPKIQSSPDYMFLNSLKDMFSPEIYKILIKILYLYVEGIISQYEFSVLISPYFDQPDQRQALDYFISLTGSKVLNRRQHAVFDRPMCEIDFSKTRKISGYYELPKEYPILISSGRTDFENNIFNDRLITIPTGSEDDKNPMKKNHYEENLFAFEDKRYEFDMQIEIFQYAIDKLNQFKEKLKDGSIKKEDINEELFQKMLGKNVMRLIIRYYRELGQKVMEKLIDKTEGTIKTWLFRAREQLKNELEGGFGDE